MDRALAFEKADQNAADAVDTYRERLVKKIYRYVEGHEQEVKVKMSKGIFEYE